MSISQLTSSVLQSTRRRLLSRRPLLSKRPLLSVFALLIFSGFLACSGGQDGAQVVSTGGSTASGGVSSGGISGSGSAASSGGDTAQASGGGLGSGGGTGGDGASSGGAPVTSGGAFGMASGGNAAGSGGAASGGVTSHWVATWATGLQITEQANLPPSPGLANNTLRQIVRVSIGGSELRLRISNEYGTAPAVINAAHIANAMDGSTIDVASDVGLTFEGSDAVTIPAGEFVASDPFDYDLEPLSKIALTLQFGTLSGDVTGHPGSRTTSFIQTGDEVSAATLNGTMTDHWYFISGIDVMAPETTKAVAILGDSITDGRGTTTNGQNRWPDRLAENLQAGTATKNVSVLNLGIGGNAILQGGLGPTALVRLQSQIIAQPGVAWVMVLEGVNDIGEDASGADVIAGLKSIVQDVRAAGLTVYGSPILPFAGSSYDSPAHQQARTEVNDWIATDGSFDAVIALDAAVSDGGSPPGLKVEFDDGDRLHLNPAGYKAMADAVDLALLQ